MEAISETRTTIERGQIAQKLESGYRVCPFAGSYVILCLLRGAQFFDRIVVG